MPKHSPPQKRRGFFPSWLHGRVMNDWTFGLEYSEMPDIYSQSDKRRTDTDTHEHGTDPLLTRGCQPAASRHRFVSGTPDGKNCEVWQRTATSWVLKNGSLNECLFSRVSLWKLVLTEQQQNWHGRRSAALSPSVFSEHTAIVHRYNAWLLASIWARNPWYQVVVYLRNQTWSVECIHSLTYSFSLWIFLYIPFIDNHKNILILRFWNSRPKHAVFTV